LDSFLLELSRRNQELLKNTDSSDDAEGKRFSLTTLAIARASLARLALARKNQSSGTDESDYPLQLVVAGPTQVGKSTVVNLLLQQGLAESSAQAGFTVHCQGFHLVDEVKDRYAGAEHWASGYFDDLSLAKNNTLDRQVLGEYSLQECASLNSRLCDMLIWDTPDFDSIRAFDYRMPLVKAIALADLLVFVVSKEKYADKTVWIMLQLLAELSIPVLVVMNKTSGAVRAELKTSFENKYRAAFPQQALPEMVFIDEYPGNSLAGVPLAGQLLESVSQSEVDLLHSAALSQIKRTDVSALKENVLGYLRNHWDDWTASASAEHRLHREYADLVERTCNDTAKRYQTEYIDSDRHQEVMQLALSELLVLLEVPGLAGPLGKIRSVVTWPVRTLLSSANKSALEVEDDRNEERRLLDELGKHATASLSASISIREKGADLLWWQTLREDLANENLNVVKKYGGALDNYQTMLQVEIDRAAQSLYKQLQQQPATLNGLRTARVTADAAAVVLAVKSGGLGAVDLVIAPAMLSLTTLLTEGALGKYMDRIQKKLTEYQEKEVQSVIERKLRRPLLQLVQQRRDDSISEEKLQKMTLKLEAGDV